MYSSLILTFKACIAALSLGGERGGVGIGGNRTMSLVIGMSSHADNIVLNFGNNYILTCFFHSSCKESKKTLPSLKFISI